MRFSRWQKRLAAGATVLALVAAGCSSDDSTTSTGPDGAPANVAGFDGTTIKLGVITPTSGVVQVIGNPLTEGQRVFVEALNAKGGIAGKYKVELVVEDSAYDSTTAVQKYASLKGSVVMFAQILGTPIVNALLQSLTDDGMVAQPASLDAFWVREQNLLPIGAPYQIQAINALDWWINQEGNSDSVICWAGQDDPYGDAGLEGVKAASEALGFTIAKEVRFAATDASADAQAPNAAALKEAGCQLVFLTTTPSPAGGLLGAAAGAQFAPQWIGQSPTWVNALAASPLKDYLKAYYAVVAEGGLWGDTSLPGMEQMLADVAQYRPDQAPDIYFVFGYAAMMAVTEVLEAAVANGDLSHDGIIEAMNSLDEIDLGGLLGTYKWGAPEDRDPPRVSRVYRIDPDSPTTGFFSPATDPFTSDAAKDFEFK